MLKVKYFKKTKQLSWELDASQAAQLNESEWKKFKTQNIQAILSTLSGMRKDYLKLFSKKKVKN